MPPRPGEDGAVSYRLSLADDVATAVRAAARTQLEGAIEQLERAGRPREDAVAAVHAARKHLKKARALLRLVRPALGRAAYRRENGALRDVAAALSATRDGDVLAATVAALADRFAGRLPAADFEAVRRALAAEAAPGRAGDDDGAAGHAALAGELRAALGRVADWPLERARWDEVLAGAARQYGRGIDAFAAAREEPTAERLHEWRKRVKDYWYHQRLLRDAFKPVMSAYADGAHALSELLGDDHDLAVLRTRLERGLAAPAAAAVDLAPLLALIDERRARLRAQAWRLGGRLYAESPKAWRRRSASWVELAVEEAARAEPV